MISRTNIKKKIKKLRIYKDWNNYIKIKMKQKNVKIVLNC